MESPASLSKTIALSTLAFLIIVLIAGCDPPTTTPDAPGTCPNPLETAYRSYDFGSPDSKYVYVLIDQSYEYRFTAADFKLVSKTVIPNISAGDRLVVAWINLQNGTQTIIFDERAQRVPLPQFPPTLTPAPVRPTLTPSGVTTIQGQQIQTNEAINSANQDLLKVQQCKIGQLNAAHDTLYQEWKTEQEQALSSFRDIADAFLSPSMARNPSSGKLIYESLSVASQMLQSSVSKKQHKHYVLLVFSDMDDWRPAKPADLPLDLKGITTLIVSENCKYSIECLVRIRWESELKSYGDAAGSLDFVAKEDDIAKSLNDLLSNIP